MNLAKILADDILARVDKPSRYLGTELNSVHKDPGDVDVRIALAFPDLYDIGLGNLGLHILYAILNALPWCWAERVYAPGLDLEALLRERGLPLFALESKDGLGAFDGIGVTLQSELTGTNILNIIDLAGMPLRTRDRRESDPLVFAGGPAVFNPEPLAPFIDFFVIGDGEDVIVEIAEVFRRVRGRAARLEALAEIEGIYVPALYPMETLPDGRILPPVDGPRIRKRLARDLNRATFPVSYIVPFTRQVHDRISLEVLRGCTQGCRFCQAGMTTRPVRERSLEEIDRLLQQTLDTTGYEEVSLVSLSTCDYSHVRSLVQQTVERAAPRKVGVSLPSLRLDSFSVELADMVADIRRTGLTVAPEAASPRLRAVINKWIPDEDLLRMATEAYRRGWDHVKLYFMIGLPTERDDDIQAIADLTLRVLEEGREIHPKARVHTGVSTFVPKPFTPFQWAAQIDIDETRRRQEILYQRFRGKGGVKFGRHHAEDTFLEGIISRADRRAADLIEAAFRLGCRFDNWDEHRDFARWQQAIEQVGWDCAFELRQRRLDERLPWDHIDVLIDKEWFVEEWRRAEQLQHAEDCRHSRCHRCGVIDRERPLCASMLRGAIEGRKAEKDWVRPPRPPELGVLRPGQPPVRPAEPPAVQRVVFRIGIVGVARFLTHLETMNAWIRALRRAKVPLAYSEGFHPHPKVAFSGARPLAEETLGDFMDVQLTARVDPAVVVERLRATVPAGFRVMGAREIPLSADSLMSAVEGADYRVYLPVFDGLGAAVERLLAADSLPVERRRKKRGRRGRPGTRTVDLRDNLVSLELLGEDAGIAELAMSLRTNAQGRGARPSEIIGLLGGDPAKARVVRLATRFRGDLAARLAGVGTRRLQPAS
ncbi:MAG: TIGR03960 family B12-binding radical SAM protein [Deltaproteobacteria bacterium]|nr:MAG: TIGR03960 family B12-binding radical SAM protein [Deltaproteobacteria bacterium]